ncbi:glycosyltransferase family 9 protein [Candidatus Woesearchaeota archaeon]|nr:glycosyltransferase family 9 protein [Candidatus Woesearchaeota archaeon]
MTPYQQMRFCAKKGIDAACFVLLLPSYLQPKKEIQKEKIEKILLINLQGIGDIIETTPLVTELRNTFPKAKIDYLCYKENGILLENDPRINNLIKRQKQGILNTDFFQTIHTIRKNKYKLVINLFPAQHSALFTILSNAQYKLGNLYSTASTANNLNVKKAAKTWDIRENCKNIAEQLQIQIKDPYQPNISISTAREKAGHKETKKRYILLNPHAQWVAKQWPNENWQEIIKFLLKEKKQYKIAIIGTKEDNKKTDLLINQFQKEKQVENWCGKYNLKELAVKIKDAKLMITTDTGPMHIALATKTKTIGLFGCTNPNILVKGNKHIEIVSSYDCCPEKLRFNHNNEPDDKQQTQMRKISTKEVMERINKIIKE